MKSRTAPLAALAAAVPFWASTPLVAPIAQRTSPQLLAGLLYAGSRMGLLIWLVIARVGRDVLRVLPGERAALAGAVLCGGLLAPVLLMSGLRSIAAETASLLLNLEIVFTALLAWWFFHENAGHWLSRRS